MQTLGFFCAVAMPFFNVPLIMRIWRRQSSDDISVVWAIGVWLCMIGMLPASIASKDGILRIFSITNAVFFSGVLLAVLVFHPRIKKLF